MRYSIDSAAVIGAGTMGLGIAGQLANAGVDVLLLDLPADDGNRNAVGERALERLLDDSQPGLLHKDLVDRITIGNVEDDFDRISQTDWIAEAVVERLDVKQALYERIDAVRKPGSIVSSNTSTIPISLLVADMPASFRREFAITHFFNPVRYMRLLELVRGEQTQQEVIDCLAEFNDERMGKGVVVCKDTPGFLGNRVGVFAIQTALHAAFEFGLGPEEADAVFGRPMGIPKTGVFGLYDLIGIDLMSDVAKSLDDILPADDAFHAVATEIPLMRWMIDEGMIGNKGSRGGFYRQRDAKTRETLQFDSRDFRPCDNEKPAIAVEAEALADITRLIYKNDRYGRYAWKVLSDTLCYAAELVPDVNESLISVDDAMKLGYNWLQGPFELLDAIGVDDFVARIEKEGRRVPAFLQAASRKTFYRASDENLQYLLADGEYETLVRAPGITRFSEKRRTLLPQIEDARASYYELPGDLGLIEFHSKANTLDLQSMTLIEDALAESVEHCRALIIHNDAQHFSCGVNLQSILDDIVIDNPDGIDRFLNHFQQTVISLRDAPIPVVAAASGLSLGGGFEVILHCDKAIFHANSVTGLVESLVGVVPGGGGVKEMVYRWTEETGDSVKGAWQAFMNIGYGKTARSPLEGAELCLYREGVDEYLMNRDRLFDRAIAAATELADDYTPAARGPIAAAGRDVCTEMIEWLQDANGKGRLTAHDVTTGSQIAKIVTGGDVDAGTLVTEQDLLDLERKAFVELCRTDETRARIEHMLSFGAPLRN